MCSSSVKATVSSKSEPHLGLDEASRRSSPMKHPFDLSGQVVIITGSSRGIGRAAAEIMASLGAKIVVSSRKLDACEDVVAAIRDKGGYSLQHLAQKRNRRAGDKDACPLLPHRHAA